VLCSVLQVLVGEYTEGSEDLSRPPAMNDEGILFDTCVDNVDDPSIFVAFECAHAYPAYLIEYS